MKHFQNSLFTKKLTFWLGSFSLLFGLALSPIAQAQESTGDVKPVFYIVIDQFSPAQKFPIAIADLHNKKSNQVDETGIAIADILRKNLKIAGYFDIISKSFYKDRTSALLPEEVNFEQWSATGAKIFIKGAYYKKGSNYIIELRLYDPQLKTMLVGKEYKVKKDRYYAAVHRFADEVMLALTGERGIFNTKIAASCGTPGKQQIVTMNVDGSAVTPVTDNSAWNLSPTWSPDASEITFTSYLKYFPELYIARAKGFEKWSSAQRLTFNNSLNITPEFTPDGSSIAFASSMNGDPDIYTIDRNGNIQKTLTKSLGIDISPTWSPDGRYIAFASERAGNLHIFVSDAQGNEATRLTFLGYQNDTPAWSPRGDKIAFIRRASGAFQIHSMNADGSFQTALTSQGSNENPSWSPDGRYLVFSRKQGGQSKLYIMMWDGSNQVPISTLNNCSTPDWSPWLNAAAEK